MKQILVEVRPNSKHLKIEQITDGVYKIHLTAPATEGKANKQLIDVLSDHFHVAKSLIAIKAGKSAKTKVIVIE
jgi:uncharacterized protein